MSQHYDNYRFQDGEKKFMGNLARRHLESGVVASLQKTSDLYKINEGLIIRVSQLCEGLFLLSLNIHKRDVFGFYLHLKQKRLFAAP